MIDPVTDRLILADVREGNILRWGQHGASILVLNKPKLLHDSEGYYLKLMAADKRGIREYILADYTMARIL